MYVAHHVLSQVVQRAVAIAATTAGTVTTVTTSAPHYLVSGDTVTLVGAAAPELAGAHVVTVLGPMTLSIPVLSAADGAAAGTVTRTRAAEPLTIEQGKLRAGLDWLAGDERDSLMAGFIAAARQKFELDTGLAVLSQVRDIYYDYLTDPWVILPNGAAPLVDVIGVHAITSAGQDYTMPADQYIVDRVGGRLGLVTGAAWPTDVRAFQPIRIQVVAGWPDPAAVPPLVLQCIGLLTAHYATAGRDLATLGTIISTTPHGYDDMIGPLLQLRMA